MWSKGLGISTFAGQKQQQVQATTPDFFFVQFDEQAIDDDKSIDSQTIDNESLSVFEEESLQNFAGDYDTETLSMYQQSIGSKRKTYEPSQDDNGRDSSRRKGIPRELTLKSSMKSPMISPMRTNNNVMKSLKASLITSKDGDQCRDATLQDMLQCVPALDLDSKAVLGPLDSNVKMNVAVTPKANNCDLTQDDLLRRALEIAAAKRAKANMNSTEEYEGEKERSERPPSPTSLSVTSTTDTRGQQMQNGLLRDFTQSSQSYRSVVSDVQGPQTNEPSTTGRCDVSVVEDVGSCNLPIAEEETSTVVSVEENEDYRIDSSNIDADDDESVYTNASYDAEPKKTQDEFIRESLRKLKEKQNAAAAAQNGVLDLFMNWLTV